MKSTRALPTLVVVVACALPASAQARVDEADRVLVRPAPSGPSIVHRFSERAPELDPRQLTPCIAPASTLPACPRPVPPISPDAAPPGPEIIPAR